MYPTKKYRLQLTVFDICLKYKKEEPLPLQVAINLSDIRPKPLGRAVLLFYYILNK